jgi:hypothetical protein
VLGDPDLAEILHKRGQDQAHEYFWDKIVWEMESIYQQILSKRLLHKNSAQ